MAPRARECAIDARNHGPVTLHLSQRVRELRVLGTRRMGFHDGPAGLKLVEVQYDLGPALSASIASALCRYGRAQTSADGACAVGTRYVLDVDLASPPYVFLHWTPESASEKGGGALEVALALTFRECGGRTRWTRNVAGYGSSRANGENGFGAASPRIEQYAPAADDVIRELAERIQEMVEHELTPELAAAEIH